MICKGEVLRPSRRHNQSPRRFRYHVYRVEGETLQVDAVILPAFRVYPDDACSTGFVGDVGAQRNGIRPGGDIDREEILIIDRYCHRSEGGCGMRANVEGKRTEVLDIQLEAGASPPHVDERQEMLWARDLNSHHQVPGAASHRPW